MGDVVAALVLKILLIAYIAYALVKFLEFFVVGYKFRISRIAAGYSHGGRAIRSFDTGGLYLSLVFVALLFATGVEYLSFATGLLVGMTVIQIYFHRFTRILPPDKAPDQPYSAIKLMSYSIQANPSLAWRELLIMSALLLWCAFMILHFGFGLLLGIGTIERVLRLH